jgi:class 3 adenylate cyclase
VAAELKPTYFSVLSDILPKQLPGEMFTVPATGGLENYWLQPGAFVSLESPDAAKRRELEEQILDLKKALSGETKGREKDQAAYKELERKLQLSFLLDRVNPKARNALLSDGKFRDKFLGQTEDDAFILSIDIRRSTELMLKARSPQDFSRFITELCTVLASIVTANYGIFDKFTGDGILAFFPSFFSGEDVGFFCMDAAVKSHRAFSEIYRRHRDSFVSVLLDTGLGIGIDCGHVRMLQMAGGLTSVGIPVVYACRMSSAPPGKTLVNHPAYSKLVQKYGQYFHFAEASIDAKNEGRMLGYEAAETGVPYTPKFPAWVSVSEKGVGS